MNNNQAGQGWNSQYGYRPQQQPQNAGHGAPQQRPMVMIPQLSPEELAQFMPQHQNLAQNPVAAYQQAATGAYQQMPQNYQPQMQYMHQQPHVQHQQSQYHQPQYQQLNQQRQLQHQQQYQMHPQHAQPQYQQIPQGYQQMPYQDMQARSPPQPHHLQQRQYQHHSPVQQQMQRTPSQSTPSFIPSQSFASPMQSQGRPATSQSNPSPSQAQRISSQQTIPSPMQTQRPQVHQSPPNPAHVQLQQALAHSTPMQSQTGSQQTTISQPTRSHSFQYNASSQPTPTHSFVNPQILAQPQYPSLLKTNHVSQQQPPVAHPVSHPSQTSHISHAPAAASSGSSLPSKGEMPRKSSKLPSTSVKHSALSLDGAGNESVDYQLLLLALADQYISTARSMSNALARSRSTTDLAKYHDLMNHGLTSLDSALNNWKFSDAKLEVRIRMQYANLLVEETDNDDTALAVLSKGVTLCDRNRLQNQKLSMQHLQARVQFKSNPKASLKLIDNVLEELVAYKNVAWIYAFRFLRVSLAMQRGSTSYYTATLQQLRSLVSLAETRRDIPVLVMAHVLEASLYIKSTSSESFEHAQRAIAAASSYQLDESLERIPQLRALLLLSDLSCDLATITLGQLDRKVKSLQELIDGIGKEDKIWRSSAFQLPTNIDSDQDLAEETMGILKKTRDGKVSMSFSWLNKNELCILGFLITGAATLQKNCLDDKAEQYLVEGISYAKGTSYTKSSSQKSLDSACASMDREDQLCVASQILLVFALAIRSKWVQAAEQLADIASNRSEAARTKYRQVLLYLDGVIKQANGALHEALASYSSDILRIPASTDRMAGPVLDLRILATLNRVSILKFSPATTSESQQLLGEVLPFCEKHHNHSIQAAVNILRTIAAAGTGMREKEYLRLSLLAGQKVHNHQLLSISLNITGARFFSGIVGDQAEKGAAAGMNMSKKIRSPLWMAVSAFNLAESDTVRVKEKEAKIHLEEAYAWWSKAPEGVRALYEQGPA